MDAEALADYAKELISVKAGIGINARSVERSCPAVLDLAIARQAAAPDASGRDRSTALIELIHGYQRKVLVENEPDADLVRIHTALAHAFNLDAWRTWTEGSVPRIYELDTTGTCPGLEERRRRLEERDSVGGSHFQRNGRRWESDAIEDLATWLIGASDAIARHFNRLTEYESGPTKFTMGGLHAFMRESADAGLCEHRPVVFDVWDTFLSDSVSLALLKHMLPLIKTRRDSARLVLLSPLKGFYGDRGEELGADPNSRLRTGLSNLWIGAGLSAEPVPKTFAAFERAVAEQLAPARFEIRFGGRSDGPLFRLGDLLVYGEHPVRMSSVTSTWHRVSRGSADYGDKTSDFQLGWDNLESPADTQLIEALDRLTAEISP